ncbi:hypothetical protein [Clostridium sp.]|uniref:hypothetical protein n=1 Tax=Clostridium sp. TaxID=1506 RepID=UPI001A5556FD|nr:hypothetical protein [Clostridium sp.]MBK5240972.1 hypothetical protein [Clostridium sp.]
MFKLVKYELRGNLFTILGICITLIIANLLLLTRIDSWGIDVVGGFSILLGIGAIIVIFIFSLNIMSKYLHQDSGYLLFTLPRSGTSIIMSRLITSLIQITLVILVSFLCAYLLIGEDIPLEFSKYFKIYGMVLIEYIYRVISFLTFIYFCMIIGKVAFRNKKIGKIGSFVVFILLILFIGWIQTKILILFPQTINITKLIGSTTIGANQTDILSYVEINIAMKISSISTTIILFMSGSYLLDKKVDL